MRKIIKAPAKINLCLSVNGKRSDGYHDLTMIMQPVTLFDTIEIEILREKDFDKIVSSTKKKHTSNKNHIDYDLGFKISKQIILKSNYSFIPTDERNLIVKITKYFFEKYNIKDKVYIYLKKMIPTCGGLGGGSSDAASVLLFLNSFYEKKLSKQELNDIAIQFGSDIPFFLYKKECLCEGKGEIITELNSFKDYYILLATPNIRVSTKDIFEKFDNLERNNNKSITNIDKCIMAINSKDVKMLSNYIFNDLETVTIPLHNEIISLKQVLLDCGALQSLMSGSGPTVFGIFNSFDNAQKCKKMLKNTSKDVFVYVAKPL